MPFTSLKRKSPASEKSRLSLDAFIDAAEDYAAGKSNVFPLTKGRMYFPNKRSKKVHATFTLSPEAKHKLDVCAEQTGISRSRLIRIWLDKLGPDELKQFYLDSLVE